MVKSYRGVGLAAVVAVVGLVWSVEAQQPSIGPNYSGAPGGLITYLLPAADGKPAALTIVEPISKRILVYHIDRTSGEIALKSARDISADLVLDHWNTAQPLPQELREGIKRQQ